MGRRIESKFASLGVFSDAPAQGVITVLGGAIRRFGRLSLSHW